MADFRGVALTVERFVRDMIAADEGDENIEVQVGVFHSLAVQLAQRHRDRALSAYGQILVNEAIKSFKGGPPMTPAA